MLRFRIAELMKQKGVTYREVSEGASVSTNTLYKLAKGKQKMIGLDVIERLLKYFECDPNELMVMVSETNRQDQA
jgi:DNA-binding Xre family transcriptional regulator